jgi:hypothetical protein
MSLFRTRYVIKTRQNERGWRNRVLDCSTLRTAYAGRAGEFGGCGFSHHEYGEEKTTEFLTLTVRESTCIIELEQQFIYSGTVGLQSRKLGRIKGFRLCQQLFANRRTMIFRNIIQ